MRAAAKLISVATSIAPVTALRGVPCLSAAVELQAETSDGASLAVTKKKCSTSTQTTDDATAFLSSPTSPSSLSSSSPSLQLSSPSPQPQSPPPADTSPQPLSSPFSSSSSSTASGCASKPSDFVAVMDGCSEELSSESMDLSEIPTSSHVPVQFMEGFSMNRVSLFGAGLNDGRWEVLSNSMPCLAMQLPVHQSTTEIGFHLLTPDLVRADRDADGLLELWPELTTPDDDRSLVRRVEDIGGNCDITISGRGISYSILVANERIGDALKIVAQCMLRPSVPQDVVERRCRDLAGTKAHPRVHVGEASEALRKIKNPVERLRSLAENNFLANHLRLCIVSPLTPNEVFDHVHNSGLEELRKTEQPEVFLTNPSCDVGVPPGYTGNVALSSPGAPRKAWVKMRLGPSAIRPAETFAYTYFLKSMLAEQGDGSLYQTCLQSTSRRHIFSVETNPDSTELEFEVLQETDSGLSFSAEAMRKALSQLMTWLAFMKSTVMPKSTFSRLCNAFNWATSYSWPAAAPTPTPEFPQASAVAADMLTARGAEQMITKTVVPEQKAFTQFLQSLATDEMAIVTEGFELSDPCVSRHPARSRKRQLSIVKRLLTAPSSGLSDMQADQIIDKLANAGLALGSPDTAEFLRSVRSASSVVRAAHGGKPVRSIRALNAAEINLLFVTDTDVLGRLRYPRGPRQIPAAGAAWPFNSESLMSKATPGMSAMSCSSSSSSEFDDDLELQLATTLETDKHMPGDVIFLTTTDAPCPNTFVSLHLNTPSVSAGSEEFVCLKLLEKIFPLLHSSISDEFPVGSVRVGLPWESSFSGLDSAINTQRFNLCVSFNAGLKEKPLLLLAKALHTPVTEEDRWAFDMAKDRWLHEIKHLRNNHPEGCNVFRYLVGFPYSLDLFETAMEQMDFDTFRRTCYGSTLRLLRSSAIEATVGGWTDKARLEKLVTAIRRLRAAPAECPSGLHGSECTSASEDYNPAADEDFQSYKLRDLKWLACQVDSNKMLLPCLPSRSSSRDTPPCNMTASLHIQFPLNDGCDAKPAEDMSPTMQPEEVAKAMAKTTYFKAAVAKALREKLPALTIKCEELTEGAYSHLTWSVVYPMALESADVAATMDDALEQVLREAADGTAENFGALVEEECEKMMQEPDMLRSCKRQEAGDALEQRVRLMREYKPSKDELGATADIARKAPRMLFVGCWNDIDKTPEGYKKLGEEDLAKIDPFEVGGPFMAVRPMHLLPAPHRDAEVLQAVCQ